jgi:uncharacterized protein
LRRALRWSFVTATLAYLGVCVVMFLLQRRMQYVPDPRPTLPAAVDLPGAAVTTLTTDDGERLVAWWIPPHDDATPVYLYLHGNGGELGLRAQRFARLTAAGEGLYAVSWRGYGGSTGTPSERGLDLDARAAYAALRREVAAERIVVFGESLGSAVAIRLATDVPVRALVLDSSFESALAVARKAYPWLPVALLMRDTYRADLAAPAVTVPVFQAHCTDDPITPLPFALALAGRFPEGSTFERVSGRCHVPPLARYDDARRAFISRVFARTAAAAPTRR